MMSQGRETDRVRSVRDRFQGAALVPGDPQYTAVMCRLWYRKVTHPPAVIVRCDSVDDVAAAFRLANEIDLPIVTDPSTRAHRLNSAGDAGLLVDTSRMRDIVIRAGSDGAICGAGATWADLDRATRDHEALPHGNFISTAQAAGLLAADGSGWATPVSWWSCDNLAALQIVTFEGGRCIVSAQEQGDVFKMSCATYGSCTIGVVTSFELSLRAVAQTGQHARWFHRFGLLIGMQILQAP
jgi:FAD/FMN-containing dehydrogenase